MNIIVQTPRLTIREFLPEEEPVYLAHFTDPEVCIHIPKRSTDERINIFRTALANYQPNKQAGIWGMFDRQSGAFIGSCLLRPFHDEADRMEVGYSMDKQHWGKGIATEMVKAMVEHAFSYESTHTIMGITTLENIASQRVLEKAGFERMPDIEEDGKTLAVFSKQRA